MVLAVVGGEETKEKQVTQSMNWEGSVSVGQYIERPCAGITTVPVRIMRPAPPEGNEMRILDF